MDFKKFISTKIKEIKKFLVVDQFKNINVIIYDEAITEPIIECVPYPKKIFILKTRVFTGFYKISIFLSAVKFLFRKKILFSIITEGFIKSLPRYCKDAYHFAVIRDIKPKLVITFLDNNPRFGRLSSYFENIRFIAIQNGLRPGWDTKESSIQDIYMSFTNKEPFIFKQFGSTIKENHCIGSLNAARVFSSIKTISKKRDLLIISGWWITEKDNDYDCINQHQAMTEMNIYLKKIIIKEKYNAQIILRTKEGSHNFYSKKLRINEKDYYKKIFGNNCSIIENNYIRQDIYKEINNSHLSVAVFTTAILEGFLYGHNCLFLDFWKNKYYLQDFPDEIVISSKNKKFMESKIKNKIEDAKLREAEINLISKKRSIATINKCKKIIKQTLL